MDPSFAQPSFTSFAQRKESRLKKLMGMVSCFSGSTNPTWGMDSSADLLGQTYHQSMSFSSAGSSPQNSRISQRLNTIQQRRRVESSAIWFDEFSEENIDTYMKFMLEPPPSQRSVGFFPPRFSSSNHDEESLPK
mmetsp:Transcript_2990/g.9165  ORF Transcript_2990/g.9165 Transcript_2990/m.9165 type:complete len:135 (-) Transcript_2990:73-477(-)|eukprot:CAMPEP_0198724282 /NCGR_PEP_ID=MMETSP1475-20131203/1781_1 /TAXON_ID= ORGANISM="Unidentified sp., Strain CCMP1999" /NCGR_SAMPLE_ID=MMETSP1475 /ASSEMBLY_ACC=CAM_ASM_001111 /LENGTH=134 /DNA_ID=CAMNT_0044485765 /DNA_START=146 /DNA_END=550 /DNA_ORIENTATION=+